MKKVLLLSLSAFVIFLTACSGDAKQTEEKPKEKTATTVEREEKKDESKVLEDDTAVLTDIDVKILETDFLPVGTYEHQETDQLIVTYEVTNKSDKEITPLIGYLAAFEAYQEDENSERNLEVGVTPFNLEKYSFASETQFDNIKNGGTVKNIVAYDLRDTETPVILRATKGIDGDLLGEIVVNLK